MNLKTRALMIGAGVAAAIHILIAICNQIITYATFDPDMYDPATINASDPDALLATLGTTAIISVLACCISFAVDILAGYLYSHFHANEDPYLQMQDGVIGGAISGTVARVISGLFGICLGIISTQYLMADLYAQAPEAAMGGLLGGVMGGVLGICLNIVFGLFFGAIGGAIGAQVRGNK